MSTYVGKLFTAVSSALEFNTATLSGAIDIVVIEDDSGRRACSPFHVRFGKLQLLKSRGIPVEIDLNGQRTPLRMLLGAAGEAYFYNPNHSQPAEDHRDHIQPTASFGDHIQGELPELDIPVRASSVPAKDGGVPLFGVATEQVQNRSQENISDSLVLVQSHVVETTTTDYPFGYISDSEVELTRIERAGTAEVVDEPRSPPLFPSQRKWSSTVAQNVPIMHSSVPRLPDLDEDVEQGELESALDTQDKDAGQDSALLGLPTPVVDSGAVGKKEEKEDLGNCNAEEEAGGLTEITSVDHSLTVSKSMNDVVGEEETKLECRSVDGYDADDDTAENLRDLQEQVAYVLARPKPLSYVERNDAEEGNGELVRDDPQSSNEGALSTQDGVVGMSLCGKLIGPDMGEDQIMELFERHLITYDEFSANPILLYDPSLLFRIDDRLVELRVAAPFIFSVLAFNKRMDIDLLARITAPESKMELPKSPPTPSRRFRWFGWASPTVVGEPLLQDEDLNVLESLNVVDNTDQPVDDKDGQGKGEDTNARKEPDTKIEGESNEAVDDKPSAERDTVSQNTVQNSNSAQVEDAMEDEQPEAKSEDAQPQPVQREKLAISFSDLDPGALTLRPTCEELNSLNLKPGANSIRFFVESSSVELNCRIFLWSCHTKIVISDVDGTITRSDVLGHLLPAVGRDWSQVGVAGLYSQIEKNGYKTLYLTARPIGQASQTRAFLHSVSQGSAKLPNGPVLMSPNRLVESFTREVIRRKPHEFKISALREIRSLFSLDYNPFHAGFGNRETDVISYRAVGLIPQRIFVVNPKGELVVMKAKYESAASYSTLQDLVESVFPDISGQDGFAKIKAMTESATYNDWNYWKGSLAQIDLDEILKRK